MGTILDIIAPARRPGRRPSEHDVNANLVFRWRQRYQEGLFGPISQSATLLPVQVIEALIDLPQVIQSAPECHSVIVVEAGKAKLRITGTPDLPTLQLILQQLLR